MVTQLQVLEAIYGPTTAYASWEIATAQRVLALFEPVAPKPLQVGDMLRTKQDYENAPIGTKVEPFWTKRSDGKWHSQDGSWYKSSRMSYRPRTVVRVGCGYAEGDTLEGAEAYRDAPAGVVVTDDFMGERHDTMSNGDGSWVCDHCGNVGKNAMRLKRVIVGVPE